MFDAILMIAAEAAIGIAITQDTAPIYRRLREL